MRSQTRRPLSWRILARNDKSFGALCRRAKTRRFHLTASSYAGQACSRDFVQNAAGGGGGVGRGRNRSSHDNMAGAGGDGLGGGGGALLVLLGGSGGSDAGSNDDKAGAEFAANLANFVGRGHHASAAGGAGQGGKPKRLVSHAARKADFPEILVVKAGEDGDGQDEWATNYPTLSLPFASPRGRLPRDRQGWATRLTGGFHRRPEHLEAPGGMDGQHADAELGGLADSAGDGIGDVVVFEVEKDVTAGGHEVADDLRTFGREQLLAYLINLGRVADRRHDSTCLGGIGNVKGNDQTLAGVGHAVSLWQKGAGLGYFLRWLQNIEPYWLQARAAQADHASRPVGQIDDPGLGQRAAVIDPDNDGFAVLQVGDPDNGAQGQMPVGCGELVHIKGFAAGGSLAVEGVSVPGGSAYLVGLPWVRPESGGATLNVLFGVRVVPGCRLQAGDQNSSHQDVGQYSSHYHLARSIVVPPPSNDV
jgi:hypothetical protein